jgi:hypothetical protein
MSTAEPGVQPVTFRAMFIEELRPKGGTAVSASWYSGNAAEDGRESRG